MRRGHFAALQPVCPRCRAERDKDVTLTLATATEEEGDVVAQGILHCPDTACRLEYPIVDGIPILVPNIQSYLSDNALHLVSRDDLTETLEGVLGDGIGPGTWFDSTRQHLSTYAWDHYADLDDGEPQADLRPGSVVRCLEAGLELAGTPLDNPIIDLGCAVGRAAFALAARSGGLVLGVDVNFSMLRLAQRVLRQGCVRYPRRRVGIVYDRREFPVNFPGADRVDFWACDSLALPFSDNTFGVAVGLNVLDCVASPLALLASVRKALRPGGRAILSTPYDWSPSVTPPQGWIGGHSQRGPDRGAGEPFLRSLLTPAAHAQSIEGLKLVAEAADVPWHTRLHDRSTVSYRVDLVVARAE